MKKTISAILVLAMAFCLLCVPGLAAGGISVTIDDVPVKWTDAEPFIDANSRTLVPLRAVGEALGLEVEWDNAAREAIFSTVSVSACCTVTYALHFEINSSTAVYTVTTDYGDGEPVTEFEDVPMDTAAVIVGGRTYAPVRYLADTFDCSVNWDAATRTVVIEHYAYYINNMGFWPDSATYCFVAGPRYSILKNLSVVSAKVNGKTCKVEQLSDETLKGLCTDLELEEGTFFYGFTVSYDELNVGDTFELEWVMHEELTDGGSGDYTYSDSTVVEGFGGIY